MSIYEAEPMFKLAHSGEEFTRNVKAPPTAGVSLALAPARSKKRQKRMVSYITNHRITTPYTQSTEPALFCNGHAVSARAYHMDYPFIHRFLTLECLIL